MIIGGAFQGKASLAEKKYPELNWVNGEEADWETSRRNFEFSCIYPKGNAERKECQ